MSLASNCFDVPKDSTRNLAKLQKLPLDDKILYSKVKIKEFYIAMKGKTYIAFSGGKDSTVLLHLVRSIYPDTPAVFMDTGLEFPEIREHVKTVNNVTWLKPEMSFKKVIEEKGYPVIGKEMANWISLAQRGQPSGIRQMSKDTRYGGKRYEYMINAPFKVSRECCNIMKKKPAHKYHKDTGRCPYIGTHADESRLREEMFKEHGENRLNSKIPSSNPLSIWTDADIWNYINKNGLKYASVYDMGYNRTGCIFCMFGITQDRDRFLKLKATHPKQWAYCMKDIDQGGLGIKQVLDFMGIPSGCEQSNLIKWEQGAQE